MKRTYLFLSLLMFVFIGCSSKKYEMYKSPCACFEEIKKAKKVKSNG